MTSISQIRESLYSNIDSGWGGFYVCRRGSASASSYKWGKQNGEVRERARFNQPVALAYDEVTKTFYVGDSGNYKIRKIAKEQASDDLVGEESNDNQDQENQ